MPVLKITWHTHPSELSPACPVCAPLNNHEWTFNREKDPFPDYLIAPFFGGPPVWNCQNDAPLTHGPASRRGPWNCRCTLTWTMDYSDVKDKMLDLIGTVERWSGVGDVLVARKEGKFVAWKKL